MKAHGSPIVTSPELYILFLIQTDCVIRVTYDLKQSFAKALIPLRSSLSYKLTTLTVPNVFFYSSRKTTLK